MKTYLTAAVAAATSVVVKLDTVDLIQTKGATAAADTEAADQTNWAVVDWTPAVTTGAVAALKGKYAVMLAGTDTVTIAHAHPTTGVNTAITGGSITLNANPTLAAAQILSDANGYVANAASVGVTLNAYVGGSSTLNVTFLANNASNTNELGLGTDAANGSNTSISNTDVVGITIAGITVTGTANATSLAPNIIAARIAALWAGYSDLATATGYTVTQGASAASDVLLIAGDPDGGSRFDGGAVAIVVGTGVDTSSDPVVGYKIGDLKATGDNVTASKMVIITAESVNSGVDYNTIQAGGVTFTSASFQAVAMSVTSTYTAGQSFNVYKGDAFSDVTNVVDTDPGTSTTATVRDYLAWVA
jgi:hypothetical protein